MLVKTVRERAAAPGLLPVNSPVGILLFLAKDLGQLNSRFQTHFPDGFVRDNMNRNFNPFISKRVAGTINFKAVEEKKKKKSDAQHVHGWRGLYTMQAEASMSRVENKRLGLLHHRLQHKFKL